MKNPAYGRNGFGFDRKAGFKQCGGNREVVGVQQKGVTNSAASDVRNHFLDD